MDPSVSPASFLRSAAVESGRTVRDLRSAQRVVQRLARRVFHSRTNFRIRNNMVVTSLPGRDAVGWRRGNRKSIVIFPAPP
jgi:hypothetical protein